MVKLVCPARAVLGEGGRWNVEEQCLYWVDIGQCLLHRFVPESGELRTRGFDEPVSALAFRGDGGLLLAMREGCALLDRWDAEPRPFGPAMLTSRDGMRLNDGRTDSAGRFWVGSYDPEKKSRAALYRLDGDGAVTLIEEGMNTSNGHAFSPDGGRFHHSDTGTHAVSAYDADPAGGSIGNKRTLHQFPHGHGRPDGGCFDAEGCYWVCLFDGGKVVRLSPEGDIVAQVDLPASRPTTITLGGPDLRTAFVTTARNGLSDEQLADQPDAGGLFSFPVDTPGIPEWRFNLRRHD